MRERRSVAIDSVSESPVRHPPCDAIVLIDVLCDTTTLVTAIAQGRACYPAASAPAALYLARTLRDPLVAANEDDAWRPGFEVYNSPFALAARADSRPFVMACATGATLAENAFAWPSVYLACLRNLSATARHLALRHNRVLILDAAHDADVRCEDQMAAARLVRRLAEEGFGTEGLGTRETVERWGEADLSLASWGRSAEELRRSGRERDLEFVLSHVDDLEVACTFENGRASLPPSEQWAQPLSVIA